MKPAAERLEPEQLYDTSLLDVIGTDTRLLFVGINPGLSAVRAGAPFPGHGNRFFPTLHRAGITERLIDTTAGFLPGDREHLIERGIGITALVPRATARADELSTQELRDGVVRLTTMVEGIRPTVVAFLGITAYRIAFAEPGAVVGPQPDVVAGARMWVVPNPSGLNRRTALGDLVSAYRAAATAAGLQLRDRRSND